MIENVRGLLTSPAGSPGDVEPCPWCLGDTAGQPALRALGAVLGSLADLGYDAKWLVLRASDVGAPHRRERTFLAAWPAGHPAEDADQQHREERRLAASVEAEERGARSEPDRRGRVAAAADPKASDGIKGSPNQRHGNGDMTLPSAAASLLPTPRASDTGTPGRRPGKGWRPPLSAVVLPLWAEETPEEGARTGDGERTDPPSPDGRASPARPRPPRTRPVGSARTSWSGWQGLDAGWVTATPGLGRPAQLTALGNGVVPQQASHALQLLAPPFPRCPRCADR